MGATVTSYDLWSEIQGIPFVDDTFRSSKLLTIVATLRRTTDEGKRPLAEYLNPGIACSIYARKQNIATQEFSYTTISREEALAIESALTDISSAIPSWGPLLRVPIHYSKLTSCQLSLTNPLLPQKVFLGENAIADNFTLIETLVHELSHVWMGFICELFDFQYRDRTELYTLPSGTPGKDLRGLMFASTFAASVLRYYELAMRARGANDRMLRRVDRLTHYFSGTMDSLKRAKDASPISVLLIERLHQFHQTIT